jgi:hypothetical protein
MKRLIGSLLLVLTLCAAVAAQKDNDTKNDATDKTRAQRFAPSSLGIFRDFGGKPNQTRSNIEKLGDYVSLDEVQFVVKDGAVYFGMPGSGVLVPMSGGGASGCFTRDLPQRIERLRI